MSVGIKEMEGKCQERSESAPNFSLRAMSAASRKHILNHNNTSSWFMIRCWSLATWHAERGPLFVLVGAWGSKMVIIKKVGKTSIFAPRKINCILQVPAQVHLFFCPELLLAPENSSPARQSCLRFFRRKKVTSCVIEEKLFALLLVTLSSPVRFHDRSIIMDCSLDPF